MSVLATSVDIALNSLVLSGVFLIVAIGLNIIYGLSRVMNLAHGSLYALGAYAGYTLVSVGLNFFVALLIAPIMIAVLGLIIERTVIAPMRKRSIVYTLILTYGLMFFLDGLIKYFWGNEPRFIELPAFMRQTLPIAGTHYPVFRLMTLVITAAAMAGLMLFPGKNQDWPDSEGSQSYPGNGLLFGNQHDLCAHGRFCLGVYPGRHCRCHRGTTLHH